MYLQILMATCARGKLPPYGETEVDDTGQFASHLVGWGEGRAGSGQREEES